MTNDVSSFPEPPGQSTIRLVHDGGAPTLTNVPSAETMREQLQILGNMAEFVIRARPVVGWVGKWFRRAWISVGYLFLAFGVLFIGGMFVATVIFNNPLGVNGRPAGKLEAALSLGGFLLFWVALCGAWIWMSRKTMCNRDILDAQWRLSLGPAEWISRRAVVDQVIGRCRLNEIETLLVAPSRRVMARLTSGRMVSLTGPLPPFDAGWLRDALTETLGLAVETADPVFPFVPTAEPAPLPGETLAHRLVSPDSHWKTLAGVAAINLFWNGITGVFVYQAFWGEPNVQWWMALVLIPFELVGLVLVGLLVVAVSYAVIYLRIRTTAVELSDFPLQTGGPVEAFVSQAGRLPLRRLTVHLVCQEAATYRAGTTTSTDTREVRSIKLFERTEFAGDLAPPFTADFDFDVPVDAMHSFAGTHNRIEWFINVAGKFDGWPSFERRFPVVVHPRHGVDATLRPLTPDPSPAAGRGEKGVIRG